MTTISRTMLQTLCTLGLLWTVVRRSRQLHHGPSEHDNKANTHPPSAPHNVFPTLFSGSLEGPLRDGSGNVSEMLINRSKIILRRARV